jgi:hypothetical protein
VKTFGKGRCSKSRRALAITDGILGQPVQQLRGLYPNGATGRSDDPGAAVKVSSGVEPYRLLAPLRTADSGAETTIPVS